MLNRKREAGRNEGSMKKKEEKRKERKKEGKKRQKEEFKSSISKSIHKCVEKCNIIMTLGSNTISVVTSYWKRKQKQKQNCAKVCNQSLRTSEAHGSGEK